MYRVLFIAILIILVLTILSISAGIHQRNIWDNSCIKAGGTPFHSRADNYPICIKNDVLIKI